MNGFTQTSLLDERVLALRLRSYQKEALRVLMDQHRAGARRFHVVAPPGSGKTVIGIAFLQQLGVRTLILSPNAAIQAQWMDKYGKSTSDIIDTLGAVWGNDVGHLVSHDPESGAPILSLTYQRIAVRDRDGGKHANARALADLLRTRGYGLLILDECHHLLAYWADVLLDLLDTHPMLVLGLTATPPIDRDAREQARYLDLVGPVDYQIPLPAVIKDGNLAPFQDLVCIVHPDQRERGFIRSRHEGFHQLLAQLDTPCGDLPALALFVQDLLDEPRYRGRHFPSWSLFLQKHSDLAVALGRFAVDRGLPFPPSVSMLDEMEERPTLDDITTLLQSYIDAARSVATDPAVEQRIGMITRALGELGYDWRDDAFIRRRSDIDRVLALSASKLAVLRRILGQEIRNLGDAVRALVLTDFETAQAGGRRALDGVLDPEAGGAVAAMRSITADPETDVLDPVMLTGSTVFCDDDLTARFVRELEAIAEREGWDITLETHFHGDGSFTPTEVAGRNDHTSGLFEIAGSGRDWSTRTYVLMITELFDRGVTRCLVGTRGLLGEGWDSAAANVLVDLTAVASYVSVNQMHGRSLRLDPVRPEKVANNWDVVAVLPEYERGFADWQRFVRKHEQFFGLSDDGELERGIGHVHPLLTHLQPDELAAAIPLINDDMLARSARRDEVFHAWRIGLDYRGVELPCLEYRPEPDSPLQRPSGVRSAALLRHRQEDFIRSSRRLSVLTALLATGAAAGAALAAGTTAPELLLAASGGAGAATAALLLLIRRLWLGRAVTVEETWTSEEHLLAIATVMRDTIVALRSDRSGDGEASDSSAIPSIGHSQRDDGSLRFWLESSTPEESRIFTAAMNELLRPLQDQRYILRTYRLEPGLPLREVFKTRDEMAGYVPDAIVPVPSDFSSKRERADVFHQFWQQHVGRADLLYARRGEGAELLRAHLRERFLEGRRFVKVLWK